MLRAPHRTQRAKNLIRPFEPRFFHVWVLYFTTYQTRQNMTHIVPRRTLQDIHLKKADIDDIVPMSDPSSQARAVLSHSPGPGEVWGKPPRPGRTVGYLPGAPDGPTSRRRAPPNAARASRTGGGASRRRPDVRGTSEQGPLPARQAGDRPADRAGRHGRRAGPGCPGSQAAALTSALAYIRL